MSEYDPYDHDIGPKWLRDPKWVTRIFVLLILAICAWGFVETC